MNSVKQFTLTLGLLLAFAVFLAASGLGQAQKDRRLLITDQTAIPESVTDDLSLLTTAYGKLSRYIKAASILQTRRERPLNRQTQPAELQSATEAIRFEISNVRTGAIEEIYKDIYGDLVTKPQGDVLDIGPIGWVLNNGPEYTAYQAKWVLREGSLSLIEDWEHTTVEEVLTRLGTTIPQVKNYTAYEVKVQFGKKDRSYRAMLLYHDLSAPTNRRFSFADNIVGQTALTKAFYETRPIVE